MNEVNEIIEFLENEIKEIEKVIKNNNSDYILDNKQRLYQTQYILGKIKWKYKNEV